VSERFYTLAGTGAIKAGYEWLSEQPVLEIQIVVPTKPQAGNLATVLDKDTMKRLGTTREAFDRRAFKTLKLSSYRQRAGIGGQTVLAVYLDDKELAEIDSMQPVTLCAAPWTLADVDIWAQVAAPVGGAPQPDRRDGPRGAVAAALDDLAAPLIRDSSIIHPSDKTRAAQAFKKLHKGGERLDPREIQIGAIRRGWEIGHARRLADMARSVAEDRPVKGAGGRGVWRRNILDEWRRRDQGD
jgi:hypothetical protein